MRSKTMWLTVFAVAGLLASHPQAQAADGSVRATPSIGGLPQDVQERLTVSSVGLQGVVSDLQGRIDTNFLEPQAMFRLRLNHGAAPRLDDSSEYAAVLAYAAQVYALGTGHLSVTVGDLRDAGYLPYDDPQLDPKLSVDADGSALALTTWDLYRPGSPEWLTFVRSRILLDWLNRDSFRPVSPQHRTLRGPQPSTLPRVAAFWTNPLTGAPMKEGADPGDYKLWAPGHAVIGMEGGDEPVPSINVPTRLDFAVAEGVVSPAAAAKTRAAEATPSTPAAP